MPPSPTRESERRPPRRWLRRLAVASAAATAALVGLGGVVRATGSGLGCPGWPRCFGRWVPPLEYHALIEYSHRAVAALVIVLIALLAALALLRYRREREVVATSVLALGLVLLQAGLGAVVVAGELHALLVTAHFATAMVLLGVLVHGAVVAHTGPPPPPSRGGLVGLARLCVLATFALLAVGAHVRGEGAGLVFPDWPLMDGRLVPALDSLPRALHFSHRLLALATGGLLAGLVWRARRERAPAALASLAEAALAAFLAQALVGAANVWTGLGTWPVAAHVTLAGVAWALVVATASAARRLPPTWSGWDREGWSWPEGGGMVRPARGAADASVREREA
ncbi:MAG TPA: COX15/CtaA family protein [Actinomycetota bacterium]|nr:COX15/CtaA family protein [Actinomycetota bacterium]